MNATTAAAEVQSAPVNDLNAEAPSGAAGGDINLDVVLDIPVTLSMEVGGAVSASAICCN